MVTRISHVLASPVALQSPERRNHVREESQKRNQSALDIPEHEMVLDLRLEPGREKSIPFSSCLAQHLKRSLRTKPWAQEG